MDVGKMGAKRAKTITQKDDYKCDASQLIYCDRILHMRM